MVIAEKVSKLYSSKAALESLDLSVGPGVVLGFIGPNGAGKTTTMRMLAGTMPPSSGRIVICGHDMADDPLSAKSVTGYLPENAPLYSHMRVRPFLEFCARMRGVAEASLQAAVELASKRCALDAVLDEDLEALSKGFRRRVCLAQAIIHDPKVLLLDEPTDGLDPVQKLQIRSLIREMREGRAIIVSTHILEELDAVCDRVLAISEGRKIFDGTKDEFKSSGCGPSIDIDLSCQAPSSSALEQFKALASLKSAELLTESNGKLCFALHPKPGLEGKAVVEAMDLARASGWQVESCSSKPAKLDDVFTALIEESKRRSEGGAA